MQWENTCTSSTLPGADVPAAAAAASCAAAGAHGPAAVSSADEGCGDPFWGGAELMLSMRVSISLTAVCTAAN